MTDDMIERVARAIGRAELLPDDADRHWKRFEIHARAAIEAMREPTEAMLKAAPFSHPLTNWQAMIDAATQEK
jgi:hypothetical protein